MTTFSNFGFEDGTTDGWVRGGGFWNGGAAPDPATYLPGGGKYNLSGSAISVTNAGVDSHTDNHLTTTYDGAHAAMINNSTPGQGVSVLSQQIAGFTGSNISFSYAAVLQISHATGEADGFAVMLTDATTHETLYVAAYDSATAAATFTRSSTDWYYQDWQSVTIDTTSRAGHDFTLTVIAYDCSASGHAGYVYLDGFNSAVGSVTGDIFRDFNGDLAQNPGEPDAAGWTVYSDSNGNGVFDQGEASTITDANGHYVLNSVIIGTATIRVDFPPGVWEAWGAPGVSVTVTENATTNATAIGVTGGATPFDDILTGVGITSETIGGLGGNDLIMGRGGDDMLSGDFGDDIVRGGTGADILYGERGNDHLAGNEGDDELFGGLGDDRLGGRGGADMFVFSAGFGHDRISDFSAADGDKILIDIAGVDGIEDLVFTQKGNSTIITLAAGGGDDIFVRDVAPSALTAADFVFAAAAEPLFGADAALLFY